MTDLQKEAERIIKEIRLAKMLQKKRLYEQAKRQRKAENG